MVAGNHSKSLQCLWLLGHHKLDVVNLTWDLLGQPTTRYTGRGKDSGQLENTQPNLFSGRWCAYLEITHLSMLWSVKYVNNADHNEFPFLPRDTVRVYTHTLQITAIPCLWRCHIPQNTHTTISPLMHGVFQTYFCVGFFTHSTINSLDSISEWSHLEMFALVLSPNEEAELLLRLPP